MAKRIAVYTPYLDTVGGGEKYILTIAEYLSKKNNVDFLLGTHLYNVNLEEIVNKIHKLHNLDLSKVNFIKAPIGFGSSGVSRLVFLRKYDYLFYLTDGSVFYSTAKNSFLHIQSPIQNPSNLTQKGKIKLSSWKLIMYNSEFTKKNCEETWPKKSVVVYPPVDIENFQPLKKKKQIISVGRFAAHTKSKKHEILIETFRKLSKNNKMKDWSLNLVGGILDGHENYLEELKKQAKGLEINFHTNLSFEDLKKMYGESVIYWHAAGYGEVNPENMEHFGITTVEAMAAGCIPVVINLGGQKEIVLQNDNGFLWNTPEEMIDYTLQVVNNEKIQRDFAKKSIDRSKIFSKEKFYERIDKLMK